MLKQIKPNPNLKYHRLERLVVSIDNLVLRAISLPSFKSPLRYVVSTGFISLAIVAQLALRSWIGGAPFLLLYPATFISAMIGGLGPGLVALTVATAAEWYFFLPVTHSPVFHSERDVFELLIFSFSGFLFCIVSQILSSTYQRMKQATEERQLFGELIENSADFIGIADPAGRPMYVNQAGRKMIGMPLDFPVGNTKIPEYYPPEQRSFVSEMIFKTMIEKGHWKGETFFRNWKTEKSIAVSDELFFIRDHDSNRILGIGTITRDITDQKLREEMLHISEARSSGIISISADAIISIDENQCITLFNEGAEKIFGYSKAEVLGKPLDILIPERFRSSHAHQVGEFARGSQSSRRMRERSASIFGQRKNGEEFSADAAISKLSVAGKMILTVALRDVTDQKRIEREQRFLAELGSVLASTLRYEDTLDNIVRFSVREFVDLCIVYTFDETGELRRSKAVSRDPDKKWICDLLLRIPFDRRRSNPIEAVFETKKSILIENVLPEMIEALPMVMNI